MRHCPDNIDPRSVQQLYELFEAHILNESLDEAYSSQNIMNVKLLIPHISIKSFDTLGRNSFLRLFSGTISTDTPSFFSSS